MEKQTVALIGPPSAGKTKVGRFLAELLERPFIDTDDLILHHFDAKALDDVFNKLTSDECAAVERAFGLMAAIKAVKFAGPAVIATSGSMVYEEPVMRLLWEQTHIVYLEASLDTILRRVARRPNRGLRFPPGCETIADLYKHRTPLYEKWAHRTICADNDQRKQVAQALAAFLVQEGIA